MEQKSPTIPEHSTFTPVFSGVIYYSIIVMSYPLHALIVLMLCLYSVKSSWELMLFIMYVPNQNKAFIIIIIIRLPVFCVMVCGSLFAFFSFIFFLGIVLSVQLRFTVSSPFCIFKLFSYFTDVNPSAASTENLIHLSRLVIVLEGKGLHR